jgi:hypothetical protein
VQPLRRFACSIEDGVVRIDTKASTTVGPDCDAGLT